MFKRFIIGMAVIAMTVAAAFAQETTAGEVPTNSWIAPLFAILNPILTTVVYPAIVAAILAGVAAIWRYFVKLGIVNANEALIGEKLTRDAVHQAAENALRAVIAARVGPLGDLVSGPVPQEIIRGAIEYVRSKNPDTAKNVTDANLTEIIMSKVIPVQAQIEAAKPKEPPKVVVVERLEKAEPGDINLGPVIKEPADPYLRR